MYSNDVEVFNFRPGRFLTEGNIKSDEWKLIDNIYKSFGKKNKFIFISEFLKKKKKIVKIFNSQNPIITKKQPKYNIIRWALSGRDNVFINTLCYKIYNHFKINKISNKNYWKKLCYFWSSDFRTHITEKRWNIYNKEIKLFVKKLKNKKKTRKITFFNFKKNNNYKITQTENLVNVINDNLLVKFNKQKGLTIESYSDFRVSSLPLIGKIEKGYFNQIENDVDYFSGFFQMFDRQENKKITDLSPLKDNLNIIKNDYLILKTQNKFNKFLQKKIFIFDFEKNRFGIKNYFSYLPIGSLRLNYFTLNPENYDFSKLYFETHNGGKQLEKFYINKNEINYGEAVSPICSATSGLGMTEGEIIIGDKSKKIKIYNKNYQASLIGMIYFKKIFKKNLFRFYFSGMEYDDTSKNKSHNNLNTFTWYKFTN